MNHHHDAAGIPHRENITSLAILALNGATAEVAMHVRLPE
jgi:hypothetical protein